MSNKEKEKIDQQSEMNLSRRSVLGAGAAIAGAGIIGSQLIDPVAKTAYAAGSDKPIRIGFQAHRTGIGALYGRWYERTTNAAAKYINSIGGIAGRPIKLLQKMMVQTPSVELMLLKNWQQSTKLILFTVHFSRMWLWARLHVQEN